MINVSARIRYTCLDEPHFIISLTRKNITRETASLTKKFGFPIPVHLLFIPWRITIPLRLIQENFIEYAEYVTEKLT